MGVNRSASQLKQYARGILLGNYSKAISLIVFTNLAITTLTLVLGQSAPLSAPGLIIDYLISFLITLIGCLFQVGLYSFYLNLACKQKINFKDLFTGFTLFPEKKVLSQFFIRLLSFCCFLPGLLTLMTGYFQDNNNSLIYGLLLLLSGIPFYLWISLVFSQSYFILLDFPQSTALELLKKSAALMKGQKLRLFLLELSFLPMLLLGLLSFGIGLLFVLPYQSMTYTLFYLDLVQNNHTDSN